MGFSPEVHLTYYSDHDDPPSGHGIIGSGQSLYSVWVVEAFGPTIRGHAMAMSARGHRMRVNAENYGDEGREFRTVRIDVGRRDEQPDWLGDIIGDAQQRFALLSASWL